jgi:N utilization substance protein A
MEIKELFLMAEAIANEKNIQKEDVFEALEEALSLATKKQKGWNARVELDRESGDFTTFRTWQVIDDKENFVDDDGTPFDSELHIYQKDTDNAEIDSFVEKEITNIKFDRVAAQMVKQVIIQKVRDAERNVIIGKYADQVGEVLSGMVKKVAKGNVFIELGGIDGMIARNEMIPGEMVRKGDRIKFLVKEIKEGPRGDQIVLSRCDNAILPALFAMEVPEISDGSIEIMGASRDAGSRSKVAVKARDRRIDAKGSCIGMRGTRINAVINELNGEKVDIILWDADPVQFAINAIAPAEVSSIVVNENNNSMDIAFSGDELAKAIGRGGQNIKMASQLTGWRLNAISEEEALEKQQSVEEKLTNKLAEQLSVETDVASVLVAEGFATIDDIAEAEVESLIKIEGLTEEIIEDLQERAGDAQLVAALDGADSSEALTAVEGVDEDLADALVGADIATVGDLADLSIDELLEIYQLEKQVASDIIIAAREADGWFD